MSAGLVSKISKMGTTASYPQDGITIDVRVIDIKSSFGSIRYEITPISGTGKKWVNEESLRWA